MAATPEQEALAADPSTDAHTLADLAYDEPELWPAIAAHPNAYPDLIGWMHENGLADSSTEAGSEADVPPPKDAEPAAPDGAPTVKVARPAAKKTAPAASAVPAAAVATPAPAAADAPSVRESRRVKAILAGAVVVVIAMVVLNGWFAYAAFIHPNGSAGTVALSAATDYRFGADETWKTKVNVVETQTSGFDRYDATVQAYPGLWVVSWPGQYSGSSLTTETVLGMNPDTGLVMWSMSPDPYTCGSSLAAGSLVCLDNTKGSISALNPSTGVPADSPLNGVDADSVISYQGDIVLGHESVTATSVVDTVERLEGDGTVVWKRTGSCSGPEAEGGMSVSSAAELAADNEDAEQLSSNTAAIEGTCLNGTIDLDNGTINPSGAQGDTGCEQGAAFDDMDDMFTYGGPCSVSNRYPMLVERGRSTLTAITMQSYLNGGGAGNNPTVWSARLAGASLSTSEGIAPPDSIAHLGAYALVTSAGHLYGIDTASGPAWEQSDAFTGGDQVLLLPIDAAKPNTPVVALNMAADTIIRLDPGYGGERVSAEPASLPDCPRGETPVSFSRWDNGAGATLVCQGFSSTVTVILVIDGTTYTSNDGSVTPTGYRADFGSGESVDIGLGGWVVWVGNGGATTLHAASSGWAVADGGSQTFPGLSEHVEECPSGTYPLSLSTWDDGWLLTCGESGTTITRFVYVDGSRHGSGHGMTAQGEQSCGRDSDGRQVCVSASPAVVSFTSSTGSLTQHSVIANYVAGKGFSGVGKGTGAYGLADPGANAASQVAYLNGILQQSESARASVKNVVRDILRCSATDSDVQSAQAVASDRSTELQALESAPVDAVPNGSALVEQLQSVLEDSLTADQAYVTAANQVASGDCHSGISTYNSQAGLIDQITSEKGTFANMWNAQIAPQYGTPTYTQNDI